MVEAIRVYPKALTRVAGVRAGYQPYKAVLISAVTELGTVNQARMRHIHAVVSSLRALAREDALFFFDRIPDKIKSADMQRDGLNACAYQRAYQDRMLGIFQAYGQLSREEKEMLMLAVWAHDLGVPFGVEWEHSLNGAEVVRQLIPDRHFQEPVASLVEHHGEFSNLVSSSFPHDIYRLAQRWQPALLILDFCDATGRIDQEERHSNPIGLASLEYYLALAQPNGLTNLENAQNLFDLRFRYGFGPIIFNRSLREENLKAMLDQAAKLTPDARPEDLVAFYGGRFRCHFFDILLLAALETPEERGHVLASVFQTYHEAQMTGEALLWPNQDLGRILGEDCAGFVTKFKSYYKQHRLQGLLKAALLEGQIKFLCSKFLSLKSGEIS